MAVCFATAVHFPLENGREYKSGRVGVPAFDLPVWAVFTAGRHGPLNQDEGEKRRKGKKK